MEAFSDQVRKKIVRLYQQGWDTEDIAITMAASESGVRRVWQQFREQGRLTAIHGGGRQPLLNDMQKQQVLQMIAEKPDQFLHELVEQIEHRLGIRVGRQTVGRWLNAWGFTRKKSR
jgi:transposase